MTAAYAWWCFCCDGYTLAAEPTGLCSVCGTDGYPDPRVDPELAAMGYAMGYGQGRYQGD